MPVPKKQPTTLSPEGSTSESASNTIPEQEEFRQYLRRLAVSAIQVLIEQVMREELEQCIGASWGECTPTRHGYRNGSYTRDLVTRTGRMEALKVPRDREGQFHSQVFERYQRYEPEVAEALTQMFVSGVSTHKVGEVAQTLTGVAPSASAVWCINSRALMNAIPKREQQEVTTELTGIWKQEKKEDALLNLAAFKAKYRQRYPEAVRSLLEDEEHLLTFYAFPPVMHRYIRSTNAIESLFSNVRQRTDQIDVFTTETSCVTIVWAVMQDIRLPKIPVGYRLNPDRCSHTTNQSEWVEEEEVVFAHFPGSYLTYQTLFSRFSTAVSDDDFGKGWCLSTGCSRIHRLPLSACLFAVHYYTTLGMVSGKPQDGLQ